MITKLLVSAAIVLGSVWAAAPASADRNPAGTDSFDALGCSCQQTAPPDSPAAVADLQRGIWAGVSASPDNKHRSPI
jgi:hypothetical protein